MKTWKIFPGICLAMILAWGFAPGVFGALLTSDQQAVLLGGNTPTGDTTGILSFSKLNQLNPNGTQTPFVLPANKSMVITNLQITVRAVDTSLTANVDLRMGPFYSRTAATTTGFASCNEAFLPGILISPQGWGNNSYNNFYGVNLQNSGIIPGQVSVRIVGYLVPYPG